MESTAIRLSACFMTVYTLMWLAVCVLLLTSHHPLYKHLKEADRSEKQKTKESAMIPVSGKTDCSLSLFF